ncbi:MAG: DUF2628 domain-containing protein [Gemmatimonas sp.]
MQNDESSTPQNASGNGQHTPSPNELPPWANKPSASTPFSEARMAAYIGPRWESTYRAKLSPFFEDPAFAVTWNWAAALGQPFWFLYRKLYMSFILFIIVPQLAMGLLMANDPPKAFDDINSPEMRQYLIMWAGVSFSTAIAAGGTGNWFLFRRARAASLLVSMQQGPEDVAISRLQRLGGVSLRSVVVFFAITTLFYMMTVAAGAS